MTRPCLLAAISALIISAVADAQTELKKPNLVIFMADDLGWNDVGYHGSEIRTPHIDTIVRGGVELDRFYAYPACSPTRAALMTGRSPVSMGIVAAIRDFAHGVPLDEHLMPESFQAAGYQTWLLGKWHLGADHRSDFPQSRGFDHFYGHLGGNIDYYSHVYQGRLDWQRNGVTVREEGYSTDLIAREAVNLLRKRKPDKPVFLFVSFNAPHFPLAAPSESVAKYAHIENETRRTYAAAVDAMDAAIGTILTTLDQQEMSDNTLILWLSDNGGVSHSGGRNSPLRGLKKSAFEGGIRVPAALKWPNVLPSGTKSDQMIVVHDLFPTLAAACGVEEQAKKPLYGENLWPALRSGKTVPRGDTLIGDEDSWAFFQDDWKYVSSIDPKSGTHEAALFKIRVDPLEENNLADHYPEVARKLQELTDAFPKKNLIEAVPREPMNYQEDPKLQSAAEAASRE